MLMLFWRDVWCSGWRISVDRWCFNPVCALSTSHPPPHHASLCCYIDPYTSPSSSHRKQSFLFACLHCSLNNPARSGSKKSTRLFHVTRVYIYTHRRLWCRVCLHHCCAKTDKHQWPDVTESPFDLREHRTFISVSDKAVCFYPERPAPSDPHFG